MRVFVFEIITCMFEWAQIRFLPRIGFRKASAEGQWGRNRASHAL